MFKKKIKNEEKVDKLAKNKKFEKLIKWGCIILLVIFLLFELIR